MKYTQYEENTLKRLQKEELGILKEFIRICDKYDLKYFLVYGTAIGAVRHQGFIPWDDDMDVAMLRDDYDKFLEVADKEFNGKYKNMGPDCKEKYYNFVPNMSKNGTKFNTIYERGKYDVGILIDIFPLDYVAPNEKDRNKQFFWTRLWRNLYVLKNVNFLKIGEEGLYNKIKHTICAIAHYMLSIVPGEFLYNKYKKHAFKYKGQSNIVTTFCDWDAKVSCASLDDIFPLKEADFEGIKVKIPNNIDKILTNIYGDYMQLPPEDKRQNHYPYYLSFGEE
ncbi:MAG: LicD family protein [Clostridiaceae bacterium]|nr:LicD family protein [Clostridiaceae bacterium]